MNLNDFKQFPLMGILRGIEEKAIAPLTAALISSGLKTVEITMNTPNADLLIKKMNKESCGMLSVGAGTVLNNNDFKKAIDSGAEFIVMPVLIPEVMKSCLDNNISVFPGAFTPQEIYNAWNAGASMVKVFPAKFFGPEYFKEIRGPFDKIKLLACGGVNSGNIQEFFNCGASAVAFGGSLFKKQWIEENNFSKIESEIKKLIQGVPGI